jgi:uncharacterized protein YlbG (UPF0298 family)
MKMIPKKMKTMHYKLLNTVLLFVLISDLISGQSFSEKKSFRNSVPANKDLALEVNNKYGNIHITSWNTDSVVIRVEIEAFSSNLERLHKMFDGIKVNMSETSFLVRAETEFTQNINMLFEEFKGMTNKIIPFESRIQVNYFINAPDYLNMKISNKYGEVYMENSTGTFSLNLSNGSFKANSLNKIEGINLTFCDATINKMNGGNIDASFSEVEIGESVDLSIHSVSSRFNLKKTGRLNTESRRDKFFIGTVISVMGDSYFTDYRLENLEKEINLLTKYGSLKVDLINKGVELITINSAYSDINLIFDPSVSYNLDIKHMNTFLVLPERNASIEKKILNEDKKEYMTFGSVGRNPGNVKVMIEASRGNIYLK